jgi:hypothetical protein
MERYINRITTIFDPLRPDHRLGIIAAIKDESTNPRYSRVLVDRGDKQPDSAVPHHNIKEARISTRRVIEENWRAEDLMYIGLLGTISKIASYEELSELGADVQHIYRSFFDWSSVKSVNRNDSGSL